MANTSLFRKILIAGFCLAIAFSACAFEHALMRIPDSLKPVVVAGEANTVAMPIAGGGVLKIQNETGGGDMRDPIPVRTKDAFNVILKALPKGKAIAAEVSGTTWYACAYEEMEMEGAMQQFFDGPAIVGGHCFLLYIRVPANRGLDATVRSMLSQITLLPPQDGNEEPAVPLVKMTKAKVPPVENIMEWKEVVVAAKRKTGKPIEKPRGDVASEPKASAKSPAPKELALGYVDLVFAGKGGDAAAFVKTHAGRELLAALKTDGSKTAEAYDELYQAMRDGISKGKEIKDVAFNCFVKSEKLDGDQASVDVWVVVTGKKLASGEAFRSEDRAQTVLLVKEGGEWKLLLDAKEGVQQ